MRTLLLGILLCSSLLPMPHAFGQADVQKWKNKSGQTIQAKFVEANAKFVTLFLKGQNYVYRLSDLSEESQALAKKLAQASPSSNDNPSIEKPGDVQLGEAEKGKDKAGYNEAEIKLVLDEHNRLRREVGLPDLKWDPGLARHAQVWADTMARENLFEHSEGDDDEGENIAYARGSSRAESIKIALIGWGEEEKVIYRQRGEPLVGAQGFKGVGHYTQMVWFETKRVGMATTLGPGGKYYTCARYFPAGNFFGKHPYPNFKKKPSNP